MFDTDVLSYAMRAPGQRDLVRRMARGYRAVIAFQTFGELWFGAFKADWGAPRMGDLDELLEEFAVYHTDDDLILRWAQLRADQELRGDPIAISDAWIAATALVLGCPLVTNDGGFRRVRVPGLVVWGVGAG